MHAITLVLALALLATPATAQVPGAGRIGGTPLGSFNVPDQRNPSGGVRTARANSTAPAASVGVITGDARVPGLDNSPGGQPGSTTTPGVSTATGFIPWPVFLGGVPSTVSNSTPQLSTVRPVPVEPLTPPPLAGTSMYHPVAAPVVAATGDYFTQDAPPLPEPAALDAPDYRNAASRTLASDRAARRAEREERRRQGHIEEEVSAHLTRVLDDPILPTLTRRVRLLTYAAPVIPTAIAPLYVGVSRGVPDDEYHRSWCPKLRGIIRTVSPSDATRLYIPCPECITGRASRLGAPQIHLRAAITLEN